MWRHRGTDRGFTLIEIVLALSITAVVLAVVYGGIRLAYRSSERGEAHMDASQQIRTLMDRIVPVIHSAYPFWIRTEDGNVLFFAGKSDSLGFVTSDVDNYRDDIPNLPGLKWVRFFVDGDGLNMEEDYFFNQKALEGEGDPDVLPVAPFVSDIAFEYLEVDADTSETTWLDEWEVDEEERFELPRAVRVSLQIETGDGSVDLPPIVARIYAFQPVNLPKRRARKN